MIHLNWLKFLFNLFQITITLKCLIDSDFLEKGDENIFDDAADKNQAQAALDSKTSRNNFPTLPRNYFSSSYEHGCAMQEIMSSLQVSI